MSQLLAVVFDDVEILSSDDSKAILSRKRIVEVRSLLEKKKIPTKSGQYDACIEERRRCTLAISQARQRKKRSFDQSASSTLQVPWEASELGLMPNFGTGTSPHGTYRGGFPHVMYLCLLE
jgi:hypothetical protein